MAGEVDRCGKEQTNGKVREWADRGGKKQTVSEKSRQRREEVDRCGKEQTNGKVREGAGKKQTVLERSRQWREKADRCGKERGATAGRNRLGILEEPEQTRASK